MHTQLYIHQNITHCTKHTTELFKDQFLYNTLPYVYVLMHISDYRLFISLRQNNLPYIDKTYNL